MRALAITLVGLLFLSLSSLGGIAFAKKGGIGKGGGYSEEGILFHSHSDRSYSGKDQFKGKGKALGREKTKTKHTEKAETKNMKNSR